MKLFDLIDKEQILCVKGISSTEADLYPHHTKNAPDEKALIFIYDGEIPARNTNEPPPYAYVVSELLNTDIPQIKVRSVRAAMAYAYSKFYKINYQDLKFIGITGTNGKTTTAMLTRNILKEAGKRVGFIGTGEVTCLERRLNEENYSYTTPPPHILFPIIKKMEEEGCEYIVMEVSSHALSQERVSPIHFEIGIFTNLSKEHSDYHETMEDYYSAKLQLIKSAQKALINIDDDYGRRAYRERGESDTSIGIIRKADAGLIDIESCGLDGTSFTYFELGVIKRFRIKLPGSYNLYNALLAIKCAKMLSIDINVIKSAIEKDIKIDGRFEIIRKDRTLIIDYAHTPDAFENILRTLNSSLIFGQSLHVVFGCGGDRDKAKRPQMGAIAEKYCDVIYITSDNCRNESFTDIAKKILLGIRDKDKARVIKDRRKAIIKCIEESKKGDVIALLGKGAERYVIENGNYRHFDEKDVIESYYSGEKDSDN